MMMMGRKARTDRIADYPTSIRYGIPLSSAYAVLRAEPGLRHMSGPTLRALVRSRKPFTKRQFQGRVDARASDAWRDSRPATYYFVHPSWVGFPRMSWDDLSWIAERYWRCPSCTAEQDPGFCPLGDVRVSGGFQFWFKERASRGGVLICRQCGELRMRIVPATQWPDFVALRHDEARLAAAWQMPPEKRRSAYFNLLRTTRLLLVETRRQIFTD